MGNPRGQQTFRASDLLGYSTRCPWPTFDMRTSSALRCANHPSFLRDCKKIFYKDLSNKAVQVGSQSGNRLRAAVGNTSDINENMIDHMGG